MKKIITAIGIIAMQMCWAQNEDFLPKITPPSPQATELGRYGNVPVGMFTGSPNVNLDIYTLQEAGISIPVTMTYSSSGVQVDGVAKQLGIDWNLIAGGVINRQINDRDDMDIPFYNVNTSNLLCEAGNAESAEISTGITDTEKDIFSFNFLGNSGKFFLNGNAIVQINPSNIKIEKLSVLNNDTPRFKITDTDGTEYFFGGINAVEKSFNRSYCGSASPPILYDTSWYLTKIKTVQGQEAVFNYEPEHLQYIQSYYQTAVTSAYTNVSIPPAGLGTPCYNEVRHETPFLKEITVNDKKLKFNYQKLEEVNSFRSKQLISMEVYNTVSNMLKKYNFNYDSFTYPTSDIPIFNSYTKSDEKHIFLKNVEEQIPVTNEKITRYSFEYYSPELVPPRHSFAKDIYGYFNGAYNTNIIYNNIPQSASNIYNAFQNINSNRNPNPSYTSNGMLKYIYYPTKGKTEIIYEPNTISKDKTITPGVTGVASFAVGETVGYNSEHYSEPFTVPTNMNVTMSAVAWRDCGQDDPVHPPQAITYIINATTGAIIKSLSASQTPSSTTASLLAGVSYKIKLKVGRPCLGANLNVTGQPAPPYTIKVNELVGGVRVAKTIDYDNNGNAEVKKYTYGTLSNPNISSGVLSTIGPNYMLNIDMVDKTNNLFNTEYKTYTMYSSPKTSSVGLDGYSIMYPSVVESFGENFERGGILHQFLANQEETPVPICGGLIRGIAFSNSFLTGSPFAKHYVRKNGNSFITVSADEYFYEHNPAFDNSIENYIGRLTMRNELYFSLSYYAINKYFLRSQFHYLSSKKSTVYDTNGQNPLKTEIQYFYNNPAHFQLTKEKTIHPDNSVNEKTLSYAYEKSNQLMIGKNMVGIPLETTETQTRGGVTKTLSKTEKVYPSSLPSASAGNLVLPLAVNSYSSYNAGTSYAEFIPDKYDATGNLLQYRTKDGTPVTFLWGYKNTQPIAKIEGITYDQLMAIASPSAIISASNDDANDPTKEALLLEALSNFRNLTVLKDKLITTYTYDPLIGVTTITPPSGIREVYGYDNFGRLKEVKQREKDNAGNYVFKKVKEINYNYKP